ncbi:MAG: hypothetical protein ACI8QF_002238 [Limisphaerales bacterium]|jgi:hypothetical protein
MNGKIVRAVGLRAGRRGILARLSLIAIVLLLSSSSSLFAQSFSIERQVIAAGGGISSGGNFSVTGTIGQSDAGRTLTGGNFAVQGGFWSAYVAIQTPGAPLIAIVQVGNTVEIRWPAAGGAGFALEDSGNVGPGAVWSLFAGQPTIVEGQNVVTVQAQAGNHFYRLRRP